MGQDFVKAVYYPRNIEKDTELKEFIKDLPVSLQQFLDEIIKKDMDFEDLKALIYKEFDKLYADKIRTIECGHFSGPGLRYYLNNDINTLITLAKTNPEIKDYLFLVHGHNKRFELLKLLEKYPQHFIDIPSQYNQLLVCLDGNYRKNTTIEKVFHALHYAIESSDAQEQFEKDLNIQKDKDK